MGRKYNNPPIKEALCEFRFSAEENWDIVAPGIIYERIKDKYPIRKSVKDIIVDFGSQSGTSISQQIHSVEKVQFWSPDEKSLVQLAPHSISMNRLAPYIAWDSFFPDIKEALNIYQDVLSPKAITRIGLRYINHIQMPSANLNLEDYFTLYPHISSPKLEPMIGFFLGIQVHRENERDILKIELTPEKPDVFRFDLDYFLSIPNAIALADTANWVDKAHESIEDAFESSITDKLRILFEEIAS